MSVYGVINSEDDSKVKMMFSINGQIHQIEVNILEQVLCNASIIIYSVLCNHHTPGFLSCI